MVEEQWEYLRSPYERAYIKLRELEAQLGPKITGIVGGLGHITFNDFTNPGCVVREWLKLPAPLDLVVSSTVLKP